MFNDWFRYVDADKDGYITRLVLRKSLREGFNKKKNFKENSVKGFKIEITLSSFIHILIIFMEWGTSCMNILSGTI